MGIIREGGNFKNSEDVIIYFLGEMMLLLVSKVFSHHSQMFISFCFGGFLNMF